MRYACVCVTQGDGEFEREGEELRDDRVVRERVTGNEPRNLCAYDECTRYLAWTRESYIVCERDL